MQHLDTCLATMKSPPYSCTVRARVRFLAYHRIKPHVPPLVRAPVNSFEFQFSSPLNLFSPKASHHRLQCGLPGYLILFDPHTFVLQRRSRFREMPSQSVFCVISMHFTATPHIPPTASVSQPASINGSHGVKPHYFTADLTDSLRTL